MKGFTCILAVSLFCVAAAAPQNLLVIDPNSDESDSNEAVVSKPKPTHEPIEYRPLRPMRLPPHFQDLGITLPPPPLSPLQFVEPDTEIDIGEIRFLLNLLDRLRPTFPWLQPASTSAPSE